MLPNSKEEERRKWKKKRTLSFYWFLIYTRTHHYYYSSESNPNQHLRNYSYELVFLIQFVHRPPHSSNFHPSYLGNASSSIVKQRSRRVSLEGSTVQPIQKPAVTINRQFQGVGRPLELPKA
jgi:hypothetical protein